MLQPPVNEGVEHDDHDQGEQKVEGGGDQGVPHPVGALPIDVAEESRLQHWEMPEIRKRRNFIKRNRGKGRLLCTRRREEEEAREQLLSRRFPIRQMPPLGSFCGRTLRHKASINGFGIAENLILLNFAFSKKFLPTRIHISNKSTIIRGFLRSNQFRPRHCYVCFVTKCIFEDDREIWAALSATEGGL